MLQHGNIDAGNVSVLVDRIVFILVMDATVVMDTEAITNPPKK